MKKENIEYFAHSIISVFGIITAVYLFSKFIFMSILPFLIGWAVAFSVRPLATRVSALTKLPKRVVSSIIGCVSVICILTLVVGILIYALGEAWDFLTNLKENNQIFEILKRILNPIESIFGEFEGSEELKGRISDAISNALSSALGSVVVFLTDFISSVPRVIIFIFVSSVSTVYFCLDLETVNSTVKKILPPRVCERMVEFKNKFLVTMLKYVRSYMILMLITFLMMIFGFLIMKIPFAILLAFAVALLDALPLIGVGTVIIPWGIFELLFGSFSRGIGLLVLFLVSWVIRQFLEPRIVGKSLGIHPIISLVLIYLGFAFFGVVGLLIVPFSTVIIEILYKNYSAPVE